VIRFIEVRETIPLFGSADYGHADDALSKTISLLQIVRQCSAPELEVVKKKN
jgi:hypothetical protein